MRPQHRTDPQPVYRPALQRDQCNQSLACRRQLDRAITSVNGELTEQVQRELFRHTLIVKPGRAEGMRSPLPVFLRRRPLLRRFSRKNCAARRIESWIGSGCQPSSRSAFLWSSVGQMCINRTLRLDSTESRRSAMRATSPA